MNDLSQRRRLAGRGLLVAALVALPLTASISYAEPAVPAPPAAPTAPAAPLPPEAPLPPAAPLAPMALQATGDVDTPQSDDEKWEFVWNEKGDEGDADHKVHKVRTVKVVRDGKELSKEEREELRRELREDMKEMRVDLQEAMKEHRMAMVELKDLDKEMAFISMDCKDGEAGETKDAKGHRVVKICTSQIMASALSGLEAARAQIASNKEMTQEIRDEVIAELDKEIARMKSGKDD